MLWDLPGLVLALGALGTEKFLELFQLSESGGEMGSLMSKFWRRCIGSVILGSQQFL